MLQPPQLLHICSNYVSTMDVKLKIALEQHVELYVWSKTISSTMCVLYASCKPVPDVMCSLSLTSSLSFLSEVVLKLYYCQTAT